MTEISITVSKSGVTVTDGTNTSDASAQGDDRHRHSLGAGEPPEGVSAAIGRCDRDDDRSAGGLMGAAYLNGPPALPWLFSRHWCDGKHPYESAVLAHAVADRSRFALQVYRCSRCGRFHIGSGIKVLCNRKTAKNLVRDGR